MGIRTEAYNTERKVRARKNREDRKKGVLYGYVKPDRARKKTVPKTIKKANAGNRYSAGEERETDQALLAKEIKGARTIGFDEVVIGGTRYSPVTTDLSESAQSRLAKLAEEKRRRQQG